MEKLRRAHACEMDELRDELKKVRQEAARATKEMKIALEKARKAELEVGAMAKGVIKAREAVVNGREQV